MAQPSDLFSLPLSSEAFRQFQQLSDWFNLWQRPEENDIWAFIWNSPHFSTTKAYKALIGHRRTHPLFKWLWKTNCQMKHKVFFWLLLKDRINTRDILQRKRMQLDSFTCDLCILQRLETATHLILRCNFAKACWESIGISYVSTRPILQIFKFIRRRLGVSFALEIIMLMAWRIWTIRNDWIFNNVHPTVQDCKRRFRNEFNLLLHRVKHPKIDEMKVWLVLH